MGEAERSSPRSVADPKTWAVKKTPRKPHCPASVFTPAESYVLYTKGSKTAVSFDDLLDACNAQRDLDPKMTWLVRLPDHAVLKVRNGSSADLKKLVQRFGGHL